MDGTGDETDRCHRSVSFLGRTPPKKNLLRCSFGFRLIVASPTKVFSHPSVCSKGRARKEHPRQTCWKVPLSATTWAKVEDVAFLDVPLGPVKQFFCRGVLARNHPGIGSPKNKKTYSSSTRAVDMFILSQAEED